MSQTSSPSGYAPASYFDDDSMLRRLNRERMMALSGPRALLMQAAHPLAVVGLLAHSSGLDEPYERLARTAEVMHTIGFGSREDADRVTRHVRAMHRRVRGRLGESVGRYPAGTEYRADDPE
ncbi:MAG TPA: oxygenase MpaB family protein, partial [Thermoleophilaceae bacterium]|nr:oxygenase MpaB family protein [Thermoleophilaceae bacterium]